MIGWKNNWIIENDICPTRLGYSGVSHWSNCKNLTIQNFQMQKLSNEFVAFIQKVSYAKESMHGTKLNSLSGKRTYYGCNI